MTKDSLIALLNDAQNGYQMLQVLNTLECVQNENDSRKANVATLEPMEF